MARAAVIVLALANLGYFAWSTGLLAVFDLVPRNLAATEPHRLARQIEPGRLRVVTPEQEREEARLRAEAANGASETAVLPGEPALESASPDASARRPGVPRPSDPPPPATAASQPQVPDR